MKNTVPPDFYRESLMNQLAPHEFIRGTQETIC